MSSPIVSLILPVYNVEAYLPQCLDSVVGQTYHNLEIVCVNDGSTDSSRSILQAYAEKDERVKIVDSPNQGLSGARNLGMQYASGDYIMFVDADDWLDLNCIEKCVSFAQEHSLDITMFPYLREYSKRAFPRQLFKRSKVVDNEAMARRIIGPVGAEIENPVELDIYSTAWGKLYRFELVKGLRFTNLKKIGTAEDALFNMFAFKHAGRSGYTDTTFYHYRKTNQKSLTSNYKPRLHEQLINLYSIIADSFSVPIEQKALQNRIALNMLGAGLNEYSSPRPLKNLSCLLHDPVFHNALSQLDVGHMPLHWKCYFLAARYRMTPVVLTLLWCIKRIADCL